jgi:2-pyrone-4,6-dicarboxylate lactonase
MRGNVVDRSDAGCAEETPKAPFRFLSGSCDTHCHLIGPAKLFPFVPTRAAEPFKDATKAMLAAMHRELGIERAVIVQSGMHGNDPAVTLDAIATSAGSYRGVVLANPEMTDSDLERLHTGGIRGVRFNFLSHPRRLADPVDLLRLADRVRDLGWHFLLHLRPEEIFALPALLGKLPIPAVIDHLGRLDPARGPNQSAVDCLLGLLANGNCWVKIAAVDKLSKQPYPFADVAEIARRLVEAAPGRMIWGTDWPHPDGRGLRRGIVPDDSKLAALIPSYAPTGEQQRKLLVENPAHLYGFG